MWNIKVFSEFSEFDKSLKYEKMMAWDVFNVTGSLVIDNVILESRHYKQISWLAI